MIRLLLKEHSDRMDRMGQDEKRHARHQVAPPHPLSSWPILFILSKNAQLKYRHAAGIAAPLASIHRA